MAKTVTNSFTKDLTKVLNKHRKAIRCDKSGLFVVDAKEEQIAILRVPDCGTDLQDDRLWFLLLEKEESTK